MGFFSGELSPEQRIRLLEREVEILTKAEETNRSAAMLALSQVNTLILALEEKGVVEIGELEKGRVKVLGAMKRVEKAKGNGQVDQNEQPTNK